MTRRLAILATHPIQYQAPVFQRLASEPNLDIHVFFGWHGATRAVRDPGFDRAFAWDIPLLEGYDHTFLENRARDPGPHHFRGIDCPRARDQIEAWEPDVVLINGWRYVEHLRALRHFHRRLPILFRGDSTLLDERPGPRRIARRAVLRWIYRHVDTALYVGAANRDYFRACGVPDARLRFSPHAVDNERFSDPNGQSNMKAERLRQSLGIADDEFVFVFAGKLDIVKAPDVALKAFHALQNPRAHIVFAGSGALEKGLNEMHVANAHFLGFRNQSEMPETYRAGDVVLVPSRADTWGLVVNEAMACGRPVIVSDKVGCARDLVEPGRTGLVVKAGDVSVLRDAMAQLESRPDEAKAMGRQSREIIDGWTIEKQVAGIRAALCDARDTRALERPA